MSPMVAMTTEAVGRTVILIVAVLANVLMAQGLVFPSIQRMGEIRYSPPLPLSDAGSQTGRALDFVVTTRLI